MKLSELIEHDHFCTVHGHHDPLITSVVSDSTKVTPGSLFVALAGRKYHGISFLEDAIAKGAVACVVEEIEELLPSVVFVQSSDARKSLARLSKVFYGAACERLDMVGITGTNGKTTTAWMVHYLLKQCGRLAGLMGTIHHHVGHQIIPAKRTTPEADVLHPYLYEMERQGAKAAVMEVSSHAIELDRVHAIPYDVICFTNLSEDHLDFHGTMDQYYQTKRTLFTQSKNEQSVAIVCIDDRWGRKLASELEGKVITYGWHQEAQIRGADYVQTHHGACFSVMSPWGDAEVSLSLFGKYHASNALGALAIMASLGFTWEKLTPLLSTIPLIPGRLEVAYAQGAQKIFVDYAHTHEALEKTLQTLREQAPGGIGVVFGCGGDRDREKRPVMGQVASANADWVIITTDNARSENPQDIAREILQGCASDQHVEIILDRKEAIHSAIEKLAPTDWLLVAGKGHETYQHLGDSQIYFDDREVIKGYF